ncbi:unnamed protein product [Paramecium primaurelia]|uniref:Dynein heavy chain coiled coil stalk domain-containing protein n=1 Tax=Paramecium primaurelia TaxID=5886 RepID=A0A8S1NUV0_PARPR|nr:unnamed protein product [Paramecium primaurelia]
MKKLILDLNDLETQSKNQESKLNKLFLELDEIFNKKYDILHPQNPKTNLLLRIRPELFALILEFLDLKTCFRFRLVSGRANICVIISLHQKIKQLHDLSKNLEYELNEQQQKYSQDIINQNLLTIQQNAQNSLTQLSKVAIDEIRMYSRPPQVVQKVISLVCILLDSNIKNYQENWSDCQKILKEPMTLLNKLLQLQIDNISDQQLKLLQAIHNVEAQQVQNISTSCYGFYLYLQSIVELRESKYYIVKNQKLHLEKQIKSNTNLIEKLQKITK